MYKNKRSLLYSILTLALFITCISLLFIFKTISTYILVPSNDKLEVKRSSLSINPYKEIDLKLNLINFANDGLNINSTYNVMIDQTNDDKLYSVKIAKENQSDILVVTNEKNGTANNIDDEMIFPKLRNDDILTINYKSKVERNEVILVSSENLISNFHPTYDANFYNYSYCFIPDTINYNNYISYKSKLKDKDIEIFNSNLEIFVENIYHIKDIYNKNFISLIKSISNTPKLLLPYSERIIKLKLETNLNKPPKIMINNIIIDFISTNDSEYLYRIPDSAYSFDNQIISMNINFETSINENKLLWTLTKNQNVYDSNTKGVKASYFSHQDLTNAKLIFKVFKINIPLNSLNINDFITNENDFYLKKSPFLVSFFILLFVLGIIIFSIYSILFYFFYQIKISLYKKQISVKKVIRIIYKSLFYENSKPINISSIINFIFIYFLLFVSLHSINLKNYQIFISISVCILLIYYFLNVLNGMQLYDKTNKTNWDFFNSIKHKSLFITILQLIIGLLLYKPLSVIYTKNSLGIIILTIIVGIITFYLNKDTIIENDLEEENEKDIKKNNDFNEKYSYLKPPESLSVSYNFKLLINAIKNKLGKSNKSK